MKNFFRKKLANGLTVLFEKRELPVISLSLAARFGSGYEPAIQKGIAHFVEHMLFKGTKKRTSRQIVKEIDEKGGEYNAFTAKTFTAAWTRLPSKYLEFSIDLLSDMFQNSQFNEKELEKERQAIIEEINMYHDTPMRHVFEELNKLMYKKPFGMPALGTKETLTSLKQADLLEKYKENYFTGNFILAVVGNADFNEICSMAEKYFPANNRKTGKFPDFKISSGIQEERRKEIEQAHLAFGLHFPSLQDEKRYAAEIFNAIFAEGSASRIYQEVREKRGLAYAIIGTLDQESAYGQELIYLGVLKEKIELAKQLVLSEFEKMADLKQDEFEKTKQKLVNSRILEREDSRNVLMDLLFEEISGNAEEYYKYEDKIMLAELEQIRDVSKLKNFSIFSLIPEK